jgi:hypothetical protein
MVGRWNDNWHGKPASTRTETCPSAALSKSHTDCSDIVRVFATDCGAYSCCAKPLAIRRSCISAGVTRGDIFHVTGGRCLLQRGSDIGIILTCMKSVSDMIWCF